MKTILTALLTLTTILFSSAQQITFDWMHRFSNGLNCQSRCMEMGTDGYLYLGADFEGTLQFLDTTLVSTADTYYNSLLAKLTPDGDLVWIKVFNGHDVRMRSLCFDSDTNLYITGYFYKRMWGDTELVVHYADTTCGINQFLMKYTPDGELIWAKSLTSVFYDQSDYYAHRQLVVDSQDNVYMIGVTHNETQYFDPTVPVPNLADSSYWVTTPIGPVLVYVYNTFGFLAKFNSDGQKQWLQTYGDNSIHPWAMAVDPSDNIAITGYFGGDDVMFGSEPASSLGARTLFLAKYHPNGQTDWVEVFGGGLDCQARSVCVDSVGNYVVTGLFEGPITINGIEYSHYLPYTGYVAKYSANGIIDWVKLIEGYVNQSSKGTFGTNLLTTVERIYVIGFFTRILYLGSSEYDVSGLWDMMVLGYDYNGVLTEAGLYSIDTSFYTTPTCIVVGEDNDLYFSITADQNYPSTRKDFAIGRANPSMLVFMNQIEKKEEYFDAFPIPANEVLTIKSKIDATKNFSIRILSISGTEVKNEHCSGKQTQIYVGDLKPGNYILELKSEEGISTIQIIKL